MEINENALKSVREYPLMLTERELKTVLETLKENPSGRRNEKTKIRGKILILLRQVTFPEVVKEMESQEERQVYLRNGKVIPWRKILTYFVNHAGIAQTAMRLNVPERVIQYIEDGYLLPSEELQNTLLNLYVVDSGKTLDEVLND